MTELDYRCTQCGGAAYAKRVGKTRVNTVLVAHEGDCPLDTMLRERHPGLRSW